MRPLEGLTVVDLSRMLPVGVLSQMLADLGARVIKIERPGTGEEAREYGGRLPGGASAGHAFIDRGKESVAVDLKHPHGLEIVRALVGRSDAVLESFRPGVAERLGVGYEQLRAVNERLVYCSVNGYGSGGPRDGDPSHDLNYLAYSGALHFSGSADGGPQLSGIQSADLIGGLAGAVGLLAALWSVRGGGPGAKVEVGLADAALWAMGMHVSSWLADGRSHAPASTAVTGAVPSYGVYRCADGRYLAVAALEPQFWAEFVDAAGRPDLLARRTDPAAIGEVADLVASRDLAAWVQLLEGRETCVTPVQTFAEALVDPQFQARGMFVPVPGSPDALQVGSPIRMARPWTPGRAAHPVVGGDAESILSELELSADISRSAREWAAMDPNKREQ
ncbi:CaiB/BaiF CoA transferase family protein [Microbacterium sp. NPDC055910]|uniref:CaiB/BaiF CoA transferase family protein n=1 Tax=Microbacterium sp. NPDC055910 TaxID=3345659 RepID=UPI0035DD3877